MKKFLVSIFASLMAIVCFAFAGCTSAKNVNVLKEFKLTEEMYAFALNKSDTALLEDVNALLAEMKEDGSLDALISSYFDGTAKFTYKNKTTEPQSGDLVVATNAFFPPFEYYEGGKLKGVDIEIASKIATKLNKTLFVKDMEFDSIIPSIQSGESQIGMAGMTVREDRLEQVNFATGYYTSAQVVTVRADDTTFDSCTTAEEVKELLKTKKKDYTIGTQNETTGYFYVTEDELPNVTAKGYTTGALAMKDLANGKIDAVILDLQPSVMIADSMNK